MDRSRPISLQTFIYRTLSLRLAIMVCIIGLVTTAVVYVVERQNLRSLVIEETRIEIQLLISRTLQLSKERGSDRRAAFRQALDERLAVRLKRDSGEFVYVCFYETNTSDIEERLATD